MKKGQTIFEILIIITILIIPAGAYFQANTESKIYNNRFGTHYTTKDFLFAGDTIKKFLGEGEHNTSNLNIKLNTGDK